MCCVPNYVEHCKMGLPSLVLWLSVVNLEKQLADKAACKALCDTNKTRCLLSWLPAPTNVPMTPTLSTYKASPVRLSMSPVAPGAVVSPAVKAT